MANDVILPEILLVEDSPSDVLLTREAMERGKLLNPLAVVEDGVEAMLYLHRQPPYQDVSRPGLILLDLNLPRMNGREVLKAIKQDPELATIPVVVLTTSRAEEDVLRSYELHANSYIAKPVDFLEFVNALKSLHHFWFCVAALPQNGDPAPTQ